MAKRRTPTDWAAYLSDPKREYDIDEMLVLEIMLLREQLNTRDGALGAMLDRVAFAADRSDGRLERLELFLHRQSDAYPTAQLDAPDIRPFRRAVRAFEDEKRAVLDRSGEP